MATRTDASGGLPRRFLRQLLLIGLSRSQRSYGYELAEAVRAYGLSVDMAGVYRELRSMEQRNILDSGWEPSDNGPDRRVYELTETGQAAVAQAVNELELARDLLTEAIKDATATVTIGTGT